MQLMVGMAMDREIKGFISRAFLQMLSICEELGFYGTVAKLSKGYCRDALSVAQRYNGQQMDLSVVSK